MTDLNYYGTPATAMPPPHRGGLIAWGVTAIVFGTLFLLSGVLSWAALIPVVIMNGRGGGGRHAIGGRFIGLLVMNSVMMFATAGGLIYLGVGCCRGRRWVRPLMIAAAWVTLVSGVVTVVPLASVWTATMTNPPPGGPALPQPMLVLMVAVGAVVWVGLMIGLPAVVIAWFRRPSVGRALAASDPRARWTDNVTVPGLAWIIVCLWLGWGAAIIAVGGVGYWFTTLVYGWGTVVNAAVGMGLMLAGYGCYRRSTVAWATSVGLIAVLAASAITFALAGDSAEYQRQLLAPSLAISNSFAPPPPATQPGGANVRTRTNTVRVPVFGQSNPAAAPSVLYVVAVGYGLWVRRRVTRPAADPA